MHTTETNFKEVLTMKIEVRDMNTLKATLLLPAFLLTAIAAMILTLSLFIKPAVAANQVAVPKMDIVDTAVAAGSFTTLVEALKAAELVDTLKGEGPFTVFAPTDEAFAKIPKDKLNALLKDKKALTKVLTYHVVPGKVMAADVVKLKSAKTVEGQSIVIDTSKGVKVDGATVTKTDIVTSNGVIHVIDTVLMPK